MSGGRIQVEVPDEAYWRRQVKCQYACPVNTDARGYVRAIAEGDVGGRSGRRQDHVLLVLPRPLLPQQAEVRAVEVDGDDRVRIDDAPDFFIDDL